MKTRHKTPKLWTIIVNWNGRDDTLACLASVARSTLKPAHVLVADNGSTDGSVAAISAHRPDVEVMVLGENLGFQHMLGILLAAVGALLVQMRRAR